VCAVSAPSPAGRTSAQELYRQLLLGSLTYSVVLGFLDAYTSIVAVRSYSYLFAASIVLEVLTVGAIWIKDLIVRHLRHRPRLRARALLVLGVWFVMFSSKFVFVWVIDRLFGDDVNVEGFFGILLVVAAVAVLQRLVRLVDDILGSTTPRPGSAAEDQPPAQPRH
jgi:hypothetical protein